MEGKIKVGYAFPETKKWINPSNQEEELTIYEEPRWSFDNNEEILEILKNSDPDSYKELQDLMKEYPDEKFYFDLGKSLRYDDKYFYCKYDYDYSQETIQDKLDNTFIFRYWNNYDDHKIDLNNHDAPLEISINDESIVKKLNNMIYNHVNENIKNYNYYKHWREAELPELLKENLNSVTKNIHETEYGYYLEGTTINDKLKTYLNLSDTIREFLLYKTFHTDENKNINFTDSKNELYIDELVLGDDEIWETKTTNKLSYYAPKEVVNTVSNFYDNYIADVIKPIAPQLALEVISKEEFTYANSAKTAYTDYIIRTEKGIIDEITGTNNLFEENDVPVIMCRIPADSILTTEFYVSKYNLNSLTENEKLNEIEKNKSGKIEITNVDLLSQITGNINWYNKNERIDDAINLIKEKYHTAEGREYLQEINSYDYKEKEQLVDNVLGMLKEHYNGENQLITLETSKDDTQTIENLYTAEDLEILIKARDAFKYGVDSLEFTRPNAEQINKGIENGLDFDILIKETSTEKQSKEQQLSSQEEKEYQEYLQINKISDPEMNRRIDSGEIFGTYEEIEKENTINNSKFNEELTELINGKLPENHIFDLGLPGEVLKNCGFPENSKITLSASRLEMKSKLTRHLFDFSDIYNLPKALNEPIAVFEYGDKQKSENVVVNIEKNGNNFLAGIHFNNEKNNFNISSIRTLYPKDNIEWINWINQGKMIYGDKEKLQALVVQQRMNGADVNKQVVQSPLYERCLESVDSIMQNFTDVKDIYTKNYPFYEDVKKAALIEQKFYAHYVEKGNLDAREIAHNEAKEFYTALVNLDTEKIDEYTKSDLHEISDLANKIKLDYFSKKTDIVSETSISYMPHREVINNAKAARAMYVNPILKGEKKGLWKAFNDFKRHGVFDIQGHSISTDKDGHITDNGFKQLATAMDIYRDKRFESARYVFLDKDGNIKDQLALSTFMPNHSISKLDETFEQVVKYAQASNTRVAFVHNHPSGNIEASLDDKRFTKNLEEYLNRNGKDLFAGHIILDHNTFNCFKPGNDWQPVSFDTTEKDRFEKENVPEFTKTKIDSVDNLLSVAKSINDTNEYNKNWIPVVFSRTDASIGGIEYFSKDYFTQNKSEDIQKDLQNIGLRCGSNRAIPVIPKELSYDEKLHSEVINKFRDGCFYDFALGNRTAKDFNLENMSTELFNYTVKEMQTNTMVESTFELPKVDKKEIGVSSKVAENTNYYKKENIQPVDLSSYIDKSKSTEVFEHDFMLNKKFVPPFVFADNNCYIRCNAKDLKINSALKLNPEKRVDVIVTKAQFAKIISDEKLKEKILKLEEYKKTQKPITPLEVASAKMSTEQEELILAQDPHLNFTDRKLTYNAMYKEIMTDVSKLDKEKAENALTLIKQSDKEFEQIKKDFIQTNGNLSKAAKNQNEAIDY